MLLPKIYWISSSKFADLKEKEPRAEKWNTGLGWPAAMITLSWTQPPGALRGFWVCKELVFLLNKICLPVSVSLSTEKWLWPTLWERNIQDSLSRLSNLVMRQHVQDRVWEPYSTFRWSCRAPEHTECLCNPSLAVWHGTALSDRLPWTPVLPEQRYAH